MLFWLFLALFLIFFVFRPLLRGALFYRNVKKTFRDAYNPNSRRRQQPPPPPKRKIFDRDQGEYVHFEDINTSAATYQETISDDGATQTMTESQTVDAEWEDLK